MTMILEKSPKRITPSKMDGCIGFKIDKNQFIGCRLHLLLLFYGERISEEALMNSDFFLVRRAKKGDP